MALDMLANTGSGNGLLPHGTKPLPKPMLTYHQHDINDIIRRAIADIYLPPMTKNELETYFLLLKSTKV